MKLALGTVQFGLNYGAFNAAGAVDEGEAARCLNLAAGAGVDLLDTARAYGESELVLGRFAAPHRFRIVTKTPALPSGGGADDVLSALDDSLKTLGADRVYGLMLHHGSDLLGRGGESIWTGLEQAKRAGKVERIGVSVYTPEEAAAINDRFPIEIIQVPFSAFDQRMRTSGMFDRLKRSDVEIHVRSVFLQGFALGDPGRLPMHLVPWRAVLERFRRHAVEHGVTPLRLALAVAEQEPAVDRIVVGAQSSRELKEILDSSVAPVDALDASALACADLNLINPSNWSATA